MVLGFNRVLPVLTWSKLFLLYLSVLPVFARDSLFQSFRLNFLDRISSFYFHFSSLFFDGVHPVRIWRFTISLRSLFFFLIYFLLLSNRWIVSIENGRRVLSAASINSTRPLSLRRWGVDLYLGPGVVFGLFFFVSALPDVVFQQLWVFLSISMSRISSRRSWQSISWTWVGLASFLPAITGFYLVLLGLYGVYLVLLSLH